MLELQSSGRPSRTLAPESPPKKSGLKPLLVAKDERRPANRAATSQNERLAGVVEFLLILIAIITTVSWFVGSTPIRARERAPASSEYAGTPAPTTFDPALR